MEGLKIVSKNVHGFCFLLIPLYVNLFHNKNMYPHQFLIQKIVRFLSQFNSKRQTWHLTFVDGVLVIFHIVCNFGGECINSNPDLNSNMLCDKHIIN